MQFSLDFLLLMLSAGALALPTNTSAVLSERDNGMGSIAAFAAGDCSGNPTGPRPKDTMGCMPFTGATNNIGVNWGSSFLHGRAYGLWVYKDNSCKQFASKLIVSNEYNNAKGTNACIDMAAHGGPWGSVMFDHFEQP